MGCGKLLVRRKSEDEATNGKVRLPNGRFNLDSIWVTNWVTKPY